jgi:17beta-estradiol 17-dehydrogenase / very-long-chain 3-oxoacyl-CoA reductase
VRFVVVDFTDDDFDGGLARIAQTTADIDVGILINNVGVAYPYARFFHEVDGELTKNLLRVNIEVTTRMIQLFLPSMLKHKCGAIINVGSGAATVLPSDPLYSLYAATKAFVDQLSRSLYVEYKHSGIDVQCQVPLFFFIAAHIFF